MKGDITINRIKRENAVHMQIVSEVIKPEVLHAHVPRLADVAQARAEYRNKMNTLQALGAHSRATGFDPTRQFQYVAQIDQSIWSMILEVFAKYNEQGELMHDGLLYVTDMRNNVVINRPFFYALLAGPLREYDMRGKIKLN